MRFINDQSDRDRVISIEGEAGVGKSSLAQYIVSNIKEFCDTSR